MSINTCSSGHDDVAYDSRHCPLCDAIKERDDLIEEKKSLEEKVAALEEKIDDLKYEIVELNEAADE